MSWKEKHLDYEIETYNIYILTTVDALSWKEKHLDYEIETCLKKRRQAKST